MAEIIRQGCQPSFCGFGEYIYTYPQIVTVNTLVCLKDIDYS